MVKSGGPSLPTLAAVLMRESAATKSTKPTRWRSYMERSGLVRVKWVLLAPPFPRRAGSIIGLGLPRPPRQPFFFGTGTQFFFGTGTQFCALNSMEREMLIEHLSQAERHVAEGEMVVERQRSLVENLARDGHDTSKQAALLQQFEERLAMHIKDRDRVLKELAKSEWTPQPF
jgi:hypothetical protein